MADALATRLGETVQTPKVNAESFYDHEYHSHRHAHLITNEEYFWARAKASVRLNFRGVNPRLRILEVGCGIGQNIASLPDAWGYDVSQEARDHCRARGIRVFDHPEEIPAASFDVVLSRHCLEHTECPLEHLKQIFRYLTPAGRLILSYEVYVW